MKVEKNQTIFKCEYCTKVSKSAAAMYSHELSCRKNPSNQLQCPKCKYFRKVEKEETIERKGEKDCTQCIFINMQEVCEKYCPYGDRTETHTRTSFLCGYSGEKMYSPKIFRMPRDIRDSILSECDRQMASMANMCEHFVEREN